MPNADSAKTGGKGSTSGPIQNKKMVDMQVSENDVNVSKAYLNEEKLLIMESPVFKQCLPRTHGKWSGERGNSNWIPKGDFVPVNKKTNPGSLKWSEIFKLYNINNIKFKNNYPDFSFISKGTVKVKDFCEDRDDNFDSADEMLALNRGCTKADVRRWRKQNKYTWHEREDCKTMDKVPALVHGNIPHSGGISIIKNMNERVKKIKENGKYKR